MNNKVASLRMLDWFVARDKFIAVSSLRAQLHERLFKPQTILKAMFGCFKAIFGYSKVFI